MLNTKRFRNLVTNNVTIGNDLIVTGTLVTVNITSSNIISTGSLSALSITGSNILATDLLTTNISVSNISASNISVNNILTSNISASNLLASNISASNIIGTNLNITSSNIVTSNNIRGTNMSASNSTITNVLSTNVSVGGTLNFSTSIRSNTQTINVSANTTSTRFAINCASTTGAKINNLLQVYSYGGPGSATQGLLNIGSGSLGYFIVNSNSNGTYPLEPISLGFNSSYYLTLMSSGSIGINTTSPGNYAMDINGNLNVSGALSKGSGTFDIEHPLDPLSKRLIHSFVESPRCDLIYRGTLKLINGIGEINLDKDCVESNECGMSEGTFEKLCMNPQCFLQNNSSFNRIIGEIIGNKLIIRCEEKSDDIINWMVIAERQDITIKNWDKTNENGNLITEYYI